MARVVNPSFEFEHPQFTELLNKARIEVQNNSFYNQMRWYIGATNINYGLNHLAETFLLRDWLEPFINQVIQHSNSGYVVYREGTYCAGGIGSNGVKFNASNYLDPVVKRFHYVVSGSGVFTSDDSSLEYAPKMLLEFESTDFGKEWVNRYSKGTEQIVICLGHTDSSNIRNWDLFAEANKR